MVSRNQGGACATTGDDSGNARTNLVTAILECKALSKVGIGQTGEEDVLSLACQHGMVRIEPPEGNGLEKIAHGPQAFGARAHASSDMKMGFMPFLSVCYAEILAHPIFFRTDISDASSLDSVLERRGSASPRIPWGAGKSLQDRLEADGYHDGCIC